MLHDLILVQIFLLSKHKCVVPSGHPFLPRQTQFPSSTHRLSLFCLSPLTLLSLPLLFFLILATLLLCVRYPKSSSTAIPLCLSPTLSIVQIPACPLCQL